MFNTSGFMFSVIQQQRYWFSVLVKLGQTTSCQLCLCDFHSYFGVTVVAMDPPQLSL